MSATEELLQLMATAPDVLKTAAIRVLRGQAVAVDPDEGVAEPYLSLGETAQRLSITRVTLWRWQVPGYDLGNRRAYRLSEVKAYLTSDEFKRRLAAMRAERRISAKEASKQPKPQSANQ